MAPQPGYGAGTRRAAAFMPPTRRLAARRPPVRLPLSRGRSLAVGEAGTAGRTYSTRSSQRRPRVGRGPAPARARAIFAQRGAAERSAALPPRQRRAPRTLGDVWAGDNASAPPGARAIGAARRATASEAVAVLRVVGGGAGPCRGGCAAVRRLAGGNRFRACVVRAARAARFVGGIRGGSTGGRAAGGRAVRCVAVAATLTRRLLQVGPQHSEDPGSAPTAAGGEARRPPTPGPLAAAKPPATWHGAHWPARRALRPSPPPPRTPVRGAPAPNPPGRPGPPPVRVARGGAGPGAGVRAAGGARRGACAATRAARRGPNPIRRRRARHKTFPGNTLPT
jgi:hypothetical protein